MEKYTFANKEVNDIIQWWLDMGMWTLTETSTGELYLDDLQDEELSGYVTEEGVINMVLDILENRDCYEEENEILKQYLEDIK